MLNGATSVYQQIKKQNGEGVARVIRNSLLLNIPDIVHVLKFAGNNPAEVQKIVPLVREMYSKCTESEYDTDKSPLELLNDVGYDAFVVENERQKNSIKKYFRAGEELCTFEDSKRHQEYFIIHAVKRGAEKIKPSNNPQITDEYATSVISIQILKHGGFISIKNRYNHTVENSDAAFGNNPDNIIHGLTNSLKKFFDVDFDVFHGLHEVPNYRLMAEQFVYYNYERFNMYFGPDYYLNNGAITKLNNDYQIMLDCFVLDTRTGELTNPAKIRNDCSFNVLRDVFRGKKIKIEKNHDDKFEKIIYVNNAETARVKNGVITSLVLQDTKKIGDGFLLHNKYLKYFSAPNVKEIGNDCFYSNRCLEKFDLPNVEKIGDDFLYLGSRNMKTVSLPNVEFIGNDFCIYAQAIETVYLPKVIEIGNGFISGNNIHTINLPNVEKIGNCFLYDCEYLDFINMPKIKAVGDIFLPKAKFNEACFPELERTGDNFLRSNNKLVKLHVPKLKYAGAWFLKNNSKLRDFIGPDYDNSPEIQWLIAILNNIVERNKLKQYNTITAQITR